METKTTNALLFNSQFVFAKNKGSASSHFGGTEPYEKRRCRRCLRSTGLAE